MEDDSKGVAAMEQYHKYLNENYVGGSERFFSPTGFLESFQKSVEVTVHRVRNHVFVKSVDEAVKKLQPVIAGCEGVFDLTAEPGTGKTSVLPFRFTEKKVVVALPTPFDAWSAYQMATGDCRLKIKGLSLGSKTARVVYTDSYMAARALLSNYLDYDILIVDECDSSKGVTKFLAEVKTPGKVLIRMSASHGRDQSGPTKSFQVTEVNDMPDVRQDAWAVSQYVKSKYAGRALVLTPDADSADELKKYLPQAKLVSTRSNLGAMAEAVTNQQGARLYISDDACARGLNLNLDALFDCQLVAEHGSMRGISKGELYQRKGRVGRNRPGFYYSPGLPCVELRDNDIDTFRHNVVRAVGDVDQLGGQRLQLSQAEANLLLCSDVEPFVKVNQIRERQKSSSPEAMVGSPPSVSGRSGSSASDKSSKKGLVKVSSPSWMFHFGAASRPDSGIKPADTYVARHKDQLCMVRRYSSSSSEGSGVDHKRKSGSFISGSAPSHSYAVSRAALPIAEEAPYAVARQRRAVQLDPMVLPMSPPVMDLNEATYDMDWPLLIRDRLTHGGDLPTLVPPGSWRHTSTGGLGSDWFRRLDDIAVADLTFSESEFEVVCRAWNKLVALVWVKQTPGLSAYSSKDRLEFCARYFQSYFLLATAD